MDEGPLSPLLDDEPWHAWGALGRSWMIKWSTRGSGYVLVVTDGVSGYYERRSAQYVAEKALEWASCVEAEPGECAESSIAQLVLEALLRAALAGGATAAGGADGAAADGAAVASGGASVGVSWREGGLTLELSAALQQHLPYCWTFCLDALSPHQVLQLVIVPLAVQVQCLAQQLQLKDVQLQQLLHKLGDLTPDGGTRPKLPPLQLEELQCAAATSVRSGGLAAALQGHLTPSVLAAVRRSATGQFLSPAKRGAGASGHRAPRHKRQPGGLSRPRPAVDAVPMLSETEEMNRREQIQALSQPPAVSQSQAAPLSQPPAATLPSKNTKKKKLKI